MVQRTWPWRMMMPGGTLSAMATQTGPGPCTSGLPCPHGLWRRRTPYGSLGSTDSYSWSHFLPLLPSGGTDPQSSPMTRWDSLCRVRWLCKYDCVSIPTGLSQIYMAIMVLVIGISWIRITVRLALCLKSILYNKEMCVYFPGAARHNSTLLLLLPQDSSHGLPESTDGSCRLSWVWEGT